MSLNIKNIILKADDKGFFTIHAEERLWQQDKQIRPLIRRQAGDLYFDQASSIITTPFETGLGRGLRTLYKGFEGENTAFETLVWVEEATGHLHCEFVPLALDQALSVQWPSPFMADEAGSYAALTHLQGYLLPVDWPEEGPQLPFGGRCAPAGPICPGLAKSRRREAIYAMCVSPGTAPTNAATLPAAPPACWSSTCPPWAKWKAAAN